MKIGWIDGMVGEARETSCSNITDGNLFPLAVKREAVTAMNVEVVNVLKGWKTRLDSCMFVWVLLLIESHLSQQNGLDDL
jgi:hypothetical protein